MKIDWAALGSVFGVSLAVTVALVSLFTLGVVGLAKKESPRGGGALTVTGAYACFAACAAAVAYGIYLIVS
ncbi:hypothetical protein [Streptomyces sp. NPDC052036]|uniref:hypothetical protein n=1 Tax=unclassified Streptomyces TaxID=2593676 RepID=UPI00341DCC2E